MLSKFLTTIAMFVVAQCAIASNVLVEEHFPSQMPLGDQTLTLSGIGVHKFFFMRIYRAGIYLKERADSAEAVLASPAPIRARLVMMHPVSASHFVLVLRDGLVANTTQEEVDSRYEEIVHFFEMMEKLGHLNEGDLVDLDFVNGQTSLRMNGKPIVSHLGDRVFYNLILRIWFGEDPISRKLKRSLLKPIELN